MFGQTYLYKKAAKKAIRAICEGIGLPKKESKRVAAVLAGSSAVLIAIKTFDFPGLKGIILEEIFDESSEAFVEEGAATVSDTGGEVHFGAGYCYKCGGTGVTTWISSQTPEPCWDCGGSGVA